MGLNIFGKSYSSYDRSNALSCQEILDRCKRCRRAKNNFPNPNPDNYVINRSLQLKNYLLIDITYPDCTNYEGRKFLLYKGTTISELIKQKHVDPHFSENKKFHFPIARFEPTKDGWKMAVEIMESQQ